MIIRVLTKSERNYRKMLDSIAFYLRELAKTWKKLSKRRTQTCQGTFGDIVT